MALSIIPFIVPMIAAIVISLLVLMYAIRHRDTVGSRAFIVLMSAVTLWQLAYLFWLLSVNPAMKVLFDKISYIGVVLVAPGWLWFALLYAGERRWVTPRWICITLILPVCMLLLAWTNDYHWLIWRDYDFYNIGSVVLQHVHYGPAFWVIIVYSYLLLLIGSYLIIRTVLRTTRYYRYQSLFLLIGALLPWAGNVLYVFKVIDIPGLDFTPFMLGLSGICVGIGLFFFHLLSIVPIARKTLIDKTEDGLLILDGNNRVVDLNPACRKILGIRESQIIGEQLTKVWKNRPLLEKYIDKMKAHSVEQVERFGELFYYDVRIQPLYKDNGTFLGRLVTIRDITEIRRAQMDRDRTQKLETFEIMAGGIVHDFHNHLSIIDGNLKLIELALADGKEINKYLGKIQEASKKANAVTRQLLTFTKGIEPRKEIINLADLLKETAELLLSASEVKYKLIIAEDLWKIDGDRELLTQVFSNLIINADQAMPGGGILKIRAVNVQSPAELPEILDPSLHYVKICFRDQGVGIPEEQLIRIFDPYFTTKPKGSGLGLAVSFTIVKKHNGYISVKSVLGKGTTFNVFLPVATSSD